LALTVNHLASLLITDTLVPLLEQSQGRVIQVNSEGHRFSGFNLKDPHFHHRFYTGLRSYGSSKTAQLHTVWMLADELSSKGIIINAMHPGAVQSEIGLNNGFLYRLFKKVIINRMLKKVDYSSDAIFYLATEPSIEKISGQYYYLTHLTTPSKHALKSKVSSEILNLSRNLIKNL
jgi:retinol dehydrogenase 13